MRSKIKIESLTAQNSNTDKARTTNNDMEKSKGQKRNIYTL